MTHIRGVISQIGEILQGRVYQGFIPKPNQLLKILLHVADSAHFPSPFPWYILDVPAQSYGNYDIDPETGLDYITIPAGWTGSILSVQTVHTQPCRGDFSVDGLTLGTAWYESYLFSYSQPLLMISTRLIDPYALSSHILRTRVFNPTNRAAQGDCLVTLLLEKI